MQLGDMVGEHNQQQQLGDMVREHNQQQQQVRGTQPEITWEVIYSISPKTPLFVRNNFP